MAADNLRTTEIANSKTRRGNMVHGVLILSEDDVYEPTEEDVARYAQFLGVDPRKEPHLLSLAREGIKAPLPRDWKLYVHDDGNPYYYNYLTEVSQWEHPCDAEYTNLIKEERTRAGIRQRDAVNEKFPINKMGKQTSDAKPLLTSALRQHSRIERQTPGTLQRQIEDYGDTSRSQLLIEQINNEPNNATRDPEQAEYDIGTFHTKRLYNTGTLRTENCKTQHGINYKNALDRNTPFRTATSNLKGKAQAHNSNERCEEVINIYYGYGENKREYTFQTSINSETGKTKSDLVKHTKTGQYYNTDNGTECAGKHNLGNFVEKENITLYYGCGSNKMECSFQNANEFINSIPLANKVKELTGEPDSDSLEETDTDTTHGSINPVKTVVYDAGIDSPSWSSKATDAIHDAKNITVIYGIGPYKKEHTIPNSVSSANDCGEMEQTTARTEGSFKTVVYDARNSYVTQTERINAEARATLITQTSYGNKDVDDCITICYGSGSDKNEYKLRRMEKHDNRLNFTDDAVRLIPKCI